MESRKRVSYNRKQKEESGMSVIRKWVSAQRQWQKFVFFWLYLWPLRHRTFYFFKALLLPIIK